MDITAIYEALEDASLFELYRLHSAIGLCLDDPQKINEIKRLPAYLSTEQPNGVWATHYCTG